MAKACSSECLPKRAIGPYSSTAGLGFAYDCDAQLFLRRALWHQYSGAMIGISARDWQRRY